MVVSDFLLYEIYSAIFRKNLIYFEIAITTF